MIKNLGQVAAIYVGKTAPRNVNMIWLDNTVIPYVFKSYNGEEWTGIPTGMWVETYVNGWLVSLQQGTVTTGDDYVLINSRGVNYRMTVKDFVKSSVGNPLDFKGVIRTDADFPNPSTLEGGDMYIIITNPTGGTVTDSYSSKTFSDSEKIVWDSVINSWASLGKIDVKVDLSTTYSATEVTIHSSAGKETTVVGVTDDNAGVMVPVQKKWLDSLSNGSTLTPQGPSTAPYHKHRYSDIVDRIISQQVTGDSAINPMSQKATTEALDLKLDKSSVLQVSGVSTTDVMSQKAVTDAIQTLKSSVDDKLSRYLPLSGGTMAGSIVLANSNVRIQGIGSDGTTNYHMVSLDTANRPTFGSPSVGVVIQTNTENILHKKANGTYIVHDTSNLPDPAKLSANQTFTGDNAFTAGKFNVTGDKSKFSVNNVGGLRMYYDYADDELGISRYLDFYTKKSSDTDYTRRGIFGLYASKSTPNSDWAYIGVGDVDSENAQYKFSLDTLYIPETFYLRTLSSRRQLISVDNINNRAGFGGTLIPTWIISNNTDLFHSKYTNQSTHSEYKIWDESNLPSPVQTSDLVDYVVKSDLDAYATKSWVGEQNYLTTASLDGYAKTTDLASYLPLAGGTLTGDLVLSNNNYIKGIVSTGTPIQILGLNSSNTISVGNGSYNLLLYTGASDISHWKRGTGYKIWDASNVSRPLDYVNGTAGSVTSVYTRNLNLNGTSYPFIGTGTTVVTLFAPTTAGTSGQVLQSQGAGKAPIWVDGGTGGGGVQLSDTNVWTGLNTFQGGLKTSDGTNSYDVWDNNSLKYPVKYEINSIGNYNFNYYTKTAGWRRIDQVAINNILPDTITSLTNGGYGGLGLGTNAYESAAIADILTNSIYFEGLNARVLSTNSDGDLEYGSTTNYGDFNSRNIRIAYPMSSGSGGGSGGSSTTYEGGLTIGYYPVNTKGTVTERAKIYCTTSNLYLKDLAKNTQLDFDTDGLYVTTRSSSKVRLATLNDVSGGGSSVSLDGNNTWTGVNIFSGTTLVTNQYDSGNTEIPSSAKYSISLACGGSYNEYGFGAIRTEDRTKQSYSFVQTPSAFFIFDNSGSLYTTIGNTKYEFWNKNNLAKPITYNTNTEGDAVLYKGDSASKIDRLVLPGMMPDDSTPNILQGGTGGFGSAEHAYASCHIGAVYTNEIHTYIDNDMTATVNLTMDDNGVYFAKSDGTLYKLTMEVVS